MQEGQPTTILIDARKLGDGGIGTYIENLVDGLLALRRRGEISLAPVLLVTPSSVSGDAARRWAGELELLVESSRKYSVAEYATLALKQRQALERAAIFHSPHYTLPYFLKVPQIVTIHDVIHVSHPETFYHRPIGKRLIASALKRADHVITVSAASKLQIEKNFGLFETPMTVIPNSLRTIFFPPERRLPVQNFVAQRFGLPQNYCLFVGSDRPHKGFHDLCRAWRHYQQQAALTARENEPFVLAVVGERFSAVARSEAEALGEVGGRQTVHFLGAVADGDLPALYRSARALVVPSTVEGFGLPALEAMASGTAVICRRLPSLAEFCADTAWYAQDDSIEALAAVISDALAENSRRRLEEKCERAAKLALRFFPEAAARATCSVYELVLQRAADERRYPHAQRFRAAAQSIFNRQHESSIAGAAPRPPAALEATAGR